MEHLNNKLTCPPPRPSVQPLYAPIPNSPFPEPSPLQTASISSSFLIKKWLNQILEGPSGLKDFCAKYNEGLYSEIEAETALIFKNIEIYFQENGVQTSVRYQPSLLESNLQAFSDDQTRSATFAVSEISLVFQSFFTKLLAKEASNNIGNGILESLKTPGCLSSFIACSFVCWIQIQIPGKVSFQQVLKICETSVYHFWRTIKIFVFIDPEMPNQITHHFNNLNNSIISDLAWQENSPFLHLIGEVLKQHTNKPFQEFSSEFRKLAAYRLQKICQIIGYDSPVKDLIWKTLTEFFSEHTLELQGRGLDVVLVCTVYAISKLRCELSFPHLIRKYQKLFPSSFLTTRTIRLAQNRQGNLNQFYNHQFIDLIKNSLLGSHKLSPPRLPELNPQSPLRENLPSSQMTPRTQQLWAYGNSPYSTAPAVTGTRISFQRYSESQPRKKFRTLNQILEGGDE